MTFEHSDRESIIDWLHGRRQAMLEAIRFYQSSDGVATPQNIREYSGVPSGSFDHHIGLLQDPPDHLNLTGLVEVSGREDLGYGNPTRIFSLTDQGETILEMTGDEPGLNAEDLATKLADVEQQLATMNEKFEAIRLRLDRIDEKVDEQGLGLQILLENHPELLDEFIERKQQESEKV